MLSKQEIREIVQASFNSLYKSGTISHEIRANNNMVLLGIGTELDSIAFVTFFMDIEDRLRIKTQKDIFLVHNEVHEYNKGNKSLTLSVLESYIEKVLLEASNKNGK